MADLTRPVTVMIVEDDDDMRDLLVSAGQPVTITFEVVREADHGWQIDHISGRSGDVSWCSNDLVAAVQAAKGAN